jgi:cephalosporin-C deacetylase
MPPLVDLPLDELRTYCPPLTQEPDFDAFWHETLETARQIPLDPALEPVAYPARGVTVYRASYDGWDGARITGWYLVPARRDGPLPGLASYHGYSGWTGEPHHYLAWALQGYAVLAVDVRGQAGGSDDPTPYPGGHGRGWMTMGIRTPRTYFYRGAYMDCVRALDFLQSRGEVDMGRVGVMGTSQGGGLSLAVAALDPRPRLALPEVPFLCHFRRALDVAQRDPYLELSEYLKRYPKEEDNLFRTLSYFDGMNLAPRVRCPLLVTVGLQDTICPPSTVFAAFNHLGSATKEIAVYPYHGHEMVEAHWEAKFRWANRHLWDGAG